MQKSHLKSLSQISRVLIGSKRSRNIFTSARFCFRNRTQNALDQNAQSRRRSALWSSSNRRSSSGSWRSVRPCLLSRTFSTSAPKSLLLMCSRERWVYIGILQRFPWNLIRIHSLRDIVCRIFWPIVQSLYLIWFASRCHSYHKPPRSLPIPRSSTCRQRECACRSMWCPWWSPDSSSWWSSLSSVQLCASGWRNSKLNLNLIRLIIYRPRRVMLQAFFVLLLYMTVVQSTINIIYFLFVSVLNKKRKESTSWHWSSFLKNRRIQAKGRCYWIPFSPLDTHWAAHITYF